MVQNMGILDVGVWYNVVGTCLVIVYLDVLDMARVLYDMTISSQTRTLSRCVFRLSSSLLLLIIRAAAQRGAQTSSFLAFW
jgi:hypothetical protein